MKEKLYSIEEVAVKLGVSYRTVCNWYSFKMKYPDDEWSKKLPEYSLGGFNNTKRLWDDEGIKKLKAFKNALPKGRAGVMGRVTQVWYHRKKEKENEATGATD